MHSVKSRVGLTAGVLLALAGASAHAQTQSVVYETTLPDYDEIYFFESDSAGGYFDQRVIEGLPKFDPALGTLVDVILTFNYDLEIGGFLESQGILNPGVTHTAGFSLFQFAVGVTFESTAVDPPTFNILGEVDTSFGLSCVGNPGDGDACSEGFGTFYSGGAFGFSLINNILLDDFIGTGDYLGFTFEVDYIDPMFDLFNVDFAFAELAGFQNPSNTSISLEYVYTTGIVDTDGDGIDDALDNCVNASNAGQDDTDGDGYGNACDADVNNDCVINVVDLGALRSAFFSNDALLDFNSDGVVNISDLGIMRANFFGVPGPSGMGGICDTARTPAGPIYTRDSKTGLYQ